MILCCAFHNDTLGSSELSFRAGRSETQSPPFSKIIYLFPNRFVLDSWGELEKSHSKESSAAGFEKTLKVTQQKWKVYLHPGINDKMS